jgi:hypothetical protein
MSTELDMQLTRKIIGIEDKVPGMLGFIFPVMPILGAIVKQNFL